MLTSAFRSWCWITLLIWKQTIMFRLPISLMNDGQFVSGALEFESTIWRNDSSLRRLWNVFHIFGRRMIQTSVSREFQEIKISRDSSKRALSTTSLAATKQSKNLMIASANGLELRYLPIFAAWIACHYPSIPTDLFERIATCLIFFYKTSILGFPRDSLELRMF